MDGDGDLDFAIAASFTVGVLWNDGGRHARVTGAVVGADPWRILTADVDQDGDLDLITANYDDGSVSVLIVV